MSQDQTTPSKADVLNASFDDANIKWKVERSEVLEAFSKTNEIVYDESGQPHGFLSGNRVPLRLALQAFAASEGRELADGRSSALRQANGGGNEVTSKADLRDAKTKSDYISRFGYSAFEKLPTKPVASGEVVYLEDFIALPRHEKVLRIAANPSIMSELPRRPSGQPFGGRINREKMAEIEALRKRSGRSAK